MDVNELMTIQQAADYLKVTRRAIYDAIEAGRLTAVKALGRTAVPRSEVEVYIPRAYQGKRENRRPPGVKGPGGRPRKQQVIHVEG